MRFYSEAAAVSNLTVTEYEVTYDPDASWLKFHLGINRYALYSRDDPAILQLLKDMQSMTVVSAGVRWIDAVCRLFPCHLLNPDLMSVLFYRLHSG